MPAPADLRYTETHEWHRREGSTVTLGITRFAVDELTDVTFVELPAVGAAVTAGQPIGEIESVKATGQVYSDISGKVTEVNAAAVDDPSLINNDPFGAGWLIKVAVDDPSQVEGLMDADAYNKKYPTS